MMIVISGLTAVSQSTVAIAPKAETQKAETKSSAKSVKRKNVVEETINYIKMTATAYTAGYESTQKRKGEVGYGITASGTTVQEGRTIACPRNIELGTKVYIKELKRTYVCEDRGGAIRGNRIDIFIASLDGALSFGRKEVNVYIQN